MSEPRRIGRYTIERSLGAGGMGVVYLATAPDGRRVALKSLATGFDVEMRARFRREAKLLAGLQHPGICGVVELVDEGPGAPFLVLEYVPGKTLAELARDDLPVARAVELVAAVCDAVEHAHGAGVLHRDLKPANVIVTEEGRVVVLDFGLARRIGDAESQALSRTGDILGTPGYMPPEQVRGDPATPAADQYGIGATLYACLTGEAPFRGKSTLATLQAVLDDTPTPPSRMRGDVPPGLDAVCARALQKSPDARFPSVAALAAALRDPQAYRAGTPAALKLALIAAVTVAVMILTAVAVLPAPPDDVAATDTAPTRSSAPSPTPTPTATPLTPAELDAQVADREAVAESFRRRPLPPDRAALVREFRERAAEAFAWADDLRLRHPKRPDCWVASGRVRLAFHDFKTAIAQARHALQLDPGYAPARLLLARAAWRRALWAFVDTSIRIPRKAKWVDEASRMFGAAREQGVATRPQDEAWRVTFDMLSASQGRAVTPEGFQRHRSLVTRFPDDPDVLALQAVAERYIEQKPKNAINTITRALGLAPCHPSLRRIRSYLAAEEGDTRALEDLRFAFALHPTEMDLATITKVFLDNRLLGEVDKVLAGLPKPLAATGVAAMVRAHLDLVRGRLGLAARHLAAARAKGVPPIFEPFLDLRAAQIALRRGDFATAHTSAHKAGAREGPCRDETAFTMAILHHARGDVPKALAAIDRYRRRRPSARASMIRGRILTDLGRPEEALESHRRAVRLKPRDPRYRLWLGIAQTEAKRFDAARKTLADMTRHGETIHTATLRAYLAIKPTLNVALARQACDAAIELGGRKAWIALLMRARLRDRNGDQAGAIADLELSLTAKPEQPYALRQRQLLQRWKRMKNQRR